MNKSLAVIIPVYRSTKSVKLLLAQLKKTLEPVCQYHIYLIDDGNEDAVVQYLTKNCLTEHVTMISLKKNYGQQNAVLCGLQRTARYDYTAVMDDDLQHPVKVLYQMYLAMEQGFDLIYGIPRGGEPPSVGSLARDAVFSLLLHCPKHKRVSSFRIMTKDVVKEVTKQPGSFFYFSAAALKTPKKVGNISYHQKKRAFGTSGYDWKKRLRLFANILWHYGIQPEHKKESLSLYEIKAVYPRLMVLGGSNCQLHALERAEQLDMFTLLADYTNAPVGATLADVHEKISTFDWEACTEAAKRYEIQGIMTMGTDQPVYTAAKASRALGLPSCLTPEQALRVTNKKQMKQRLAQAGLPTVPWQLIDKNTPPEALRKLKAPYVIKPLDSQGQRGIFKLNSPQEVLAHLPETLSFSRCEEALVEEFYKSDEITVSGYITNGCLTILTITDRLLYPDPVHIGVCIGHRSPSVHIDRWEEIKELSDRLTAAFELPNGPFYLQLLVGAEGIRVNELACRIGGAFEDVTIPYLTGFDILRAVMNDSLGIPNDTSALCGFRCNCVERAAAVQLMFCRPGKIAYITGEEELQKLPYVLNYGFNFKVGDTVPVMENATARFGHAVITGTKETIAEHVHQFYEILKVCSEDGTNLLQRLYP